MDLLRTMQQHGLEQVVALNDPATGLSGFIVIHDTTRGPAIGGCRLWTYPDAEAALLDGVRLAIAMTRKCALAGLNAGGGKGVLLQHPGIRDRAAMLQALGRYVESLGGRFFTSGDLGLGPADIRQMRETSRFVAVPDERTLDLGGAVAAGVVAGMKATLVAAGMGRALRGRRVVVQGLGAMGARVAALLVKEGAVVYAAELDPIRREEVTGTLGIEAVDPATVYDLPADVFCPCATSGVLDLETVERLRVAAVVGAANNQLASVDADKRLRARGIRYAPDYAVNSGAIILSARQYLERETDWRGTATRAAEQIEETVTRIFERSDATGEPPSVVADRLADEALVRPRNTERQWWPIR